MDKLIKFMAYNERVSVVCANTTELVNKVKEIHDLTPTTTAAMGRFITICGIMGYTDTKENEDSITIQIKRNGPIGSMICVVRKEENISKVKACISNHLVELPLKPNGKIDVGGAVGNLGFLNIIRKNSITDSEYNGVIPLVSGEIAEDFTEYFAKSEQKPTVLALGVLVNKDGVLSSGGYMINLMPDATEEDIQNIEKALEGAPNISQLLLDNKSLEEIAEIVTGDKDVKVIQDDLKIEYECDCNKEKFEDGLISIGKEDLEKIIDEDGKAEVVCHFCNKKYNFNKEELTSLLERIQKK